MSELQDLQSNLTSYQHQKRAASLLKQMKLTPAWKEVIEIGLFKELTRELVSDLIKLNKDGQQKNLEILTGISAFEEYLSTVLTNGEFAESNIKDTEASITQLLGEEE